MDTSNLDTVFIGGNIRKWQGKLTGVDVAGIEHQAVASRNYILERVGWKRTLLGRDLPGH